MDENNMDIEFSLKEYYDILAAMCVKLEEDPDDEIAIAAFTDAAYNIGKANCGHLFPEDLYASDLLTVNAAATPENGNIVTSVQEDDTNVVH